MPSRDFRQITVAVFGILAVLVVEFGRFREVLVVAGVIPLGIVGGLVSSTILSRVVTPVMYLLIVRGHDVARPERLAIA